MFWSCLASYCTSTLLLLILSASISLHVDAACYWPNQTLAPDDTPCFSHSSFSQCCGTNWTCLSDGVCQKQFGDSQYYYRGTCTDKTWGSPDCPSFCLGQSNYTEALGKCPNTVGGNPQFCCAGDDSCDCNTGKDTVKLSGPESTVTIIFATSWSTFSSSSSSSLSSATLSSSSSTSTSSTSTSPSPATTSTSTSSPTASSRTTTPSPLSQSSSSPNTPSASPASTAALSAGAIAGIVIGAIAALLLGLGLGYLLSGFRKRRERSTYPHGIPYSMGHGSGYAAYGAPKAPQQLETSEVPSELDARSRRVTQPGLFRGSRL